MDTFDAFEDKEFDQLNEAVLKAILSSKDVCLLYTSDAADE